MMSPRSVRFDGEVLRRLDRYVRSHPGTSMSSVTNLFVDEALRSEEHPGITFRAGPTGRRAGLVGGPDVWEVIDTLLTIREHDSGLADDALVTATAEAIGLPDRRVRTAVGYYAAYRDEIDERIEGNRQATREAEAAWQAEQSLLRGDPRAS
jgi:Arc/MetJ family transcription regulator